MSNSFIYSLANINLPYTVFKASNYASTNYPTRCTLSYKVSGLSVPSELYTFNQTTGEF